MDSLSKNGRTELLAQLSPDTTSVWPVPEQQVWYLDAVSHWLLLASTNGSKSLDLHKSVFSPKEELKCLEIQGWMKEKQTKATEDEMLFSLNKF